MIMDVKKLSAAVNWCTASKTLALGKLLHQKSIVSLTPKNPHNSHLCRSLITFYLSFHLFQPARQVLHSMLAHADVTSYNTLLSALSKNRHYHPALRLFHHLRLNLCPDSYTYPSALKACAALHNALHGQRIHTNVVKSGFHTDIVVASSLVGMYAKCGRFDAAVRLFDEMPERDVACWNNVISCYYQTGRPDKCLELFDEMRGLGFRPDSVTFTVGFAACARLTDLGAGKRVHEELIRSGFQLDEFVGSAIVDMYGKCGCVGSGREVFEQMKVKTVVSWNSMIGGYSLNGSLNECMQLFSRMSKEGVRPTSTTITNLFIACSRTRDLKNGKFVHGYVLRNHIHVDVFINSSLIDLYFKCGNVGYAECAFARMAKADVVLWNVMISGYVSAANYFKSLDMFNEMRIQGVRANAITFTSALSACTQLAALEQGREIHKHIKEYSLEHNEVLMCALLDMYAKCGAVEQARVVFDRLPVKDTVSWTSMITAYASHGQSVQALELFNEMQKQGAKPDHVAYLAVISACSHGGLVDQGRYYFNQMTSEYGIQPAVEHYSCLIDVLGRSGRVQEAYDILKGVPKMKADAGILASLFSACNLHGNLELGEEVAGLLIELDPDDHSTYILLSNMYASVGKWDEVRKVRARIKGKGFKKNPGCSWIEIDKKFHQFYVEDDSHQQAEIIYGCLGNLLRHMEKDKYQLPAREDEM